MILIILLSFILIKKNPKVYKKHRHKLYLFLGFYIVIVLSFLCFCVYKENFNQNNNNQSGGKNVTHNSRSKITKLRERCGLPENYRETSHCFADGTHQTCCMLGPEARKYADNTGNPIGKASIKAYKKKYNKQPNKDEATPWCTCFGSKVCSYYANKFNDGTHIKFVNNPNSKTDIRSNVSPKCEGYFRNKFSIRKHGTPGISNVSSNNLSTICETSEYSRLNKI